MKSHHARALLSATGLTLLVGAAYAQDDSYYYGGLGVGQSQAKIDEGKVAGSLFTNNGLQTNSITRNASDTAYKVFGGYQFNRNFGLELGYFNLGQFGFTALTTPPGTLNGQIKVHGFNLDLVGTLPITENLSALGRVGATSALTEDSFAGTGAVLVTNPSPSKRETNYKPGVGLQYAFNPSFLVRGEAERYRISDAVGGHGGVNMFSVSLVFPLGRTDEPKAVAMNTYVAPAPAPEPVVVAQAAPPPPVVMAPAPEPRRVSFSAESLFAFDNASIRPDGAAALDKFASDLRGTTFDVITVEGHTDRLGSDAHNNMLSMKRATAVKNYLVTSDKLDPAKISAVGKGESDPVTKPDDCKGNRPTVKLIACLSPDRRVDLVVNGTR